MSPREGHPSRVGCQSRVQNASAISPSRRGKRPKGAPRLYPPPLGVGVLSVFRPQAASFPRQAEGNGHRERRSAGTGVRAEGVGGGKTSPHTSSDTPNLKVGGLSKSRFQSVMSRPSRRKGGLYTQQEPREAGGKKRGGLSFVQQLKFS